jgi:predicted AAA+ superfamily ATPase
VKYTRRVIDAQLDELLADLAAVSIDGPKGVGKTATGSRRAQAVFRLDDLADREIVAADPTQLDRAPGTVLIDEWQRLPTVWDHVRRSVDDGASAGRYLLTGSVAPADAPVHSGAGRIVSLRMRPLTLAEREISAMLSGERTEIGGSSSISLSDYVGEIVASGFPGIRPLAERGRTAQLAGYLTRVVERDFPDQGLRIRRPQALRGWLAAYAAATSTTTSYNALLAAATPGESDKPAKTTTIAYRDVLSQLWLLDPVPGWVPGRGHFTQLAQAPKHHLADPALAASLLGINARALLTGEQTTPAVPRDGTLLGALFESLVTLSVRVYAQAADAETRHLRTSHSKHEVDLILERPDKKVVALEVKLGATADDASVEHLLWLRERLGDDLLDAAVITTGTRAYRRKDGVAVIPAALLGP